MDKTEDTYQLAQMTSGQIYRKLFFNILLLSATTFGGGFVIIGMMQKKFVEELGWLTEEEMLDLTAIAQSSPGALGVNIAIAVGYRIRKLKGAVVGTIGAILPPLIIISVISVFYDQFKDNACVAAAMEIMRAGVAAVICSVAIDLGKNILETKQILWILMMCAAFCASCFWKVSAVWIVLFCGAVGLLTVLIKERKAGNI